MKTLTLLAMSAALSFVAGGAQAQQAAATEFPSICKSDMAASMPMAHGDMAKQEHQKASMEGMKQMHTEMMQGMMKDDADVAFICGMIAHHRGAIAMAEVELKFGDDKVAQDMARKVIDAQTKEIAEMTGWLKDNAK